MNRREKRRMYKCRKCDGGFKQPYVASVDAGGLHDIGIVRKYRAPMIDLCPHCGSSNIKKEEMEKAG